MQEAVHNIEVLFRDRGIFQVAAADTLTQKALKSLSDLGPLKYQDHNHKHERVAAVPNGDVHDLAEACDTIANLTAAFYAAQFPMHETINAYSALDLGRTSLSWKQRKDLVCVIAQHEGMSPEELWTLSCINRMIIAKLIWSAV